MTVGGCCNLASVSEEFPAQKVHQHSYQQVWGME